ncbi:MAG: PilN domain-containing protein [Mariprofundales bacterium]
MIKVNLLPYREQRWRLQLLKIVVVASAVLLAVVALIITVHVITSSHLDGLVAEKKALMQENQRLKRKIGKIRNIDKLRADVEGKLAVVDRLQAGRFLSLQALLAMSKAIPENVWLRTIKNGGKKFSIQGQGESNNAVAELMRQLDASPDFTKVNLDVISRSTVDGIKVRAFNLTMEQVDRNTPVKKQEKKHKRGRRRR